MADRMPYSPAAALRIESVRLFLVAVMMVGCAISAGCGNGVGSYERLTKIRKEWL
jgi:hypothetical protein